MTAYNYFFILYLLPLIFNSVIFFFYGKYIEEKIDARVVYFLKITFFIPVLNFLQAISFMAFLFARIKSYIQYIIFSIRIIWIHYKARRRAIKAMKQMSKMLDIYLSLSPKDLKKTENEQN